MFQIFYKTVQLHKLQICNFRPGLTVNIFIEWDNSVNHGKKVWIFSTILMEWAPDRWATKKVNLTRWVSISDGPAYQKDQPAYQMGQLTRQAERGSERQQSLQGI